MVDTCPVHPAHLITMLVASLTDHYFCDLRLFTLLKSSQLEPGARIVATAYSYRLSTTSELLTDHAVLMYQ